MKIEQKMNGRKTLEKSINEVKKNPFLNVAVSEAVVSIETRTH